MRMVLARAAVLAVSLGYPYFLAAQDGSTGAIRGTVVDASGARVAGVQVLAVDPETALSRRAITDKEGHFSFDLLPPARYNLTANATGISKSFAILQRKDIQVEIGGAVDLELKLRLQAGETITVAGASPLVETQKSDVSHAIDELTIQELPLNGRRFSDLALLTPGVTTDPRGLTSASNGDLAFGGVRGYQTSFLVDGSDNNNAFFGQARGRYRAPYQFSNDTIQEFRVSSNSYSAEQGRSGGAVINVVTKSGTNHIHGKLFYYLRDSTFAARPPFVPFKPSDTQHQFGFTVGGPIKRDRIYYFAGFDQHIFHVPNVVEFADGSTALTLVPHMLGGAGDYESSDQALVFDTAAQLAKLTGEYRAALLGNAGFGKLDISLSPKNQLTLRVNTSRYYGDNNVFFDPASPITNNALSSNGTEDVKTESAGANLLSAISPRWTSHLRVQFSRDDQESQSNSDDVLTKITGVIDRFGQSTITPRNTEEKRLYLAETLSREWSRHSLKVGGDVSINWISNFFPQLFGGEYIFDQIGVDPFFFTPKQVGGLKLSPLRAYAHNVPRFYIQNFGNPTSHPDTQEYSWFVQDSIRVTDHFALNLGLRYDLQVFRGGLTKNPLWEGAGRVPLDANNFAPRVGFAYSIGNDKPLVFRGGYGLFHARVPQIYNSAVERNNGIDDQHLFLDNRKFADQLIFPTYPNPIGECPPSQPTCIAPAVAAANVKADISAFSENFQTPSVHQANVSVEREIVARTAISASYLFVHGEHLIRARDVNLPPPTDLTYPVIDDNGAFSGNYFTIPSFGTWQLTPTLDCPSFFLPCVNDVQRPIAGLGAINVFESQASSTYNAFTLSVRRRMSNGLALSLAYTWANAIDDAQDSPTTGTSQVQNSFSTQSERGRSSIDQRHRLVLTWVAEPRPFHREHQVLKAIFNDWKFTGLISAGSGRPLNPRILGDPNRDTNSESDRLPGARRNSFTGPDYATTDLRLTRKLFTHERFKLELLAECFNTFNRDNKRVDVTDDGFTNNAGQFVFGQQTIGANIYPASFQTLSSFLKPTSAYAPRQLQFAVKLSF